MHLAAAGFITFGEFHPSVLAPHPGIALFWRSSDHAQYRCLMRCPTLKETGGSVAPGRPWMIRRVLRISSAIIVFSMSSGIGAAIELAQQEQAKVAISPREKRSSTNPNIRLD